MIIEDDYGRNRNKLNIYKRYIVTDTPLAAEDAKTVNWDNTDVRLVDPKNKMHHTIVQIYDNKISYITLDKNHFIGMLFEDAHIADLNRTLFEFMWDHAKPCPRD